jgi:hypothetical protein
LKEILEEACYDRVKERSNRRKLKCDGEINPEGC